MDIDTSPGSNSPSCYYYSEGEYLSEHNRKVWFKSDPIDSLTVLWKSCSDTFSPVNFGVSYEFNGIKDLYDGKTDTVAAAGFGTPEEGSESYKVFKGVSLMQLTKTKGTSPSYEIESFASVVTSTDGTPDNDHVLCCKGTDTTVRTTSGSDIPNFLTMKLGDKGLCSSGTSENIHGGPTDGDQIISETNNGLCGNNCGGTNCCNNWGDNTLPNCQSMENQPRIFQARITPMPTYSKTTVLNPWLTLLESTGGVFTICDLAFLVLVLFLKKLCCCCGSSSAEDDSSEPASGKDNNPTKPDDMQPNPLATPGIEMQPSDQIAL